MAKRKTVPGIPARVIDNVEYLKRLRRVILTPFVQRIDRQLEQGRKSYEHYRDAFAQIRFDPSLEGLTETEVRRQVKRLEAHHRHVFERSMRRALGVDVSPYTLGPDIAAVMDRSIVDSVGLIKTVPVRLRDSLLTDMAAAAQAGAFDQDRVMTLLAKNYGSAGYNLRRITRDQNNKLMGRLSHERQVAVGIREYEWSTAGDERVRTEHEANSGVVFEWGKPPATGHPGEDIQCRCLAMAVIPAPGRAVARPAPPTPAPPPGYPAPGAEWTPAQKNRLAGELWTKYPSGKYADDRALREYRSRVLGSQKAQRVSKADFDQSDADVLIRAVTDADHVAGNLDGTWAGRGINSNGNHYSYGQRWDMFDSYLEDPGKGWVYAAKLEPDARVIRWVDLEDIANRLREAGDQGLPNGLRYVPGFDADFGRLALRLGYDAVDAGEDALSILNNSKIMVDREMLPGAARIKLRKWYDSQRKRWNTQVDRLTKAYSRAKDILFEGGMAEYGLNPKLQGIVGRLGKARLEFDRYASGKSITRGAWKRYLTKRYLALYDRLPNEPSLVPQEWLNTLLASLKNQFPKVAPTVPGELSTVPAKEPKSREWWEFWKGKDYKEARTKGEMKWHSESWDGDGIPQELIAAVRDTDPMKKVLHNQSSTASYTGGVKRIQMGAEAVSTRAGRGVWRHEFGHAIDMDRSWFNPLSSRIDFSDAMATERGRLSLLPGKDSARRTALNKEAMGLLDLTEADARRQANRMLKRAGLDRDRVSRLLDEDTVMGTRGITIKSGAPLTSHEREAVLWRFARAWEDDDIQGLLYMVGDPRENPWWTLMADRKIGRQSAFVRHWEEVGVIGTNLSNLLHVVTGERMWHRYAHFGNYYKIDPLRRGKEVMADSVAILGAGSFSVDFLKKAVPYIYRMVIRSLESQYNIKNP